MVNIIFVRKNINVLEDPFPKNKTHSAKGRVAA
jgi:predicted metalloenzyme YecM